MLGALASALGTASLANNLFDSISSSSQQPAWPEDKLEALIAKLDKLTELVESHFGAGALEDPQGEAAQMCQCQFENMVGEEFVSQVNDHIAAWDSLPQAQKDHLLAVLENAVSSTSGPSTNSLPSEVQELLQSMATDAATEMFQETQEEALEGTDHSGSAGGSGDTGGSGGAESGAAGNWLVQLAKAMSSIAGKHLKEMIKLQESLDASGGSGSAEEAEQFMQDTAKMQAHTQMFKAMQEAMTTVIKSVGEAINSTVRKQ